MVITKEKDICRIKIICADLITPNHGSKTFTKVVAAVGVVCNFDCDAGYALIGSEQRECQAEGSWNGIQPQCYISKCSDI